MKHTGVNLLCGWRSLYFSTENGLELRQIDDRTQRYSLGARLRGKGGMRESTTCALGYYCCTRRRESDSLTGMGLVCEAQSAAEIVRRKPRLPLLCRSSKIHAFGFIHLEATIRTQRNLFTYNCMHLFGG